MQCSSCGAQWLSGRVLDSRPRGRGFEPHRRHCVVALEQNIYGSTQEDPSPERLLMGRKESNQVADTNANRNLAEYTCTMFKVFPPTFTIHVPMHELLVLIIYSKMPLTTSILAYLVKL